MPPPARPNIVALSLLKESNLYHLFTQLLDSIRSVATLHFVESKTALRNALKTTKPSAVLLIDAAITREENADVLQQLIQFTRAGGTVVCCCNFSNRVNYRAASEYFSQWRLTWDAGSYFRTTVHRNPGPVSGMSLDGLPASYSIKSLSLIRVPAHQAVYNPSSTSLIESHVFEADEFPVDPAETPCAYAPVGQGYFGYVGDVNNEEGSTKTVLAMIHLLPSAIIPATSKPTRGLIPLPNGRFEAAPDHGDPDAPAMFSDAIRRAGEQEMMIGNRVGRTGETLPRPTAGTPIVNSPSSAPISTRTPRRPRESEVEKRAVKRAAHSKKKKEKAEQLKDQGNELFRKGDYQNSIAFYKQAIAVRGPQPTYQANLAAAYLKLNMNSEAEAACEEALKHDPKHLKARFRRGSARLNMLCFKDAIQDFKACAKLGPTNPQFPAAIINTRQEFLKMKAAGYEDQWAGSGGQELDSDEEEDEDDGFDFLEPRLDDKPLEIVSESDSSDFEHEGNDVPCRFYNHDGCLKGSKCKFKHAPSKDTTRDELGRNVCNFWLLDGCRFGDRCVYAHSKEYLPEVGWWTSGEDLMKDVMNTLNQIRGFA